MFLVVVYDLNLVGISIPPNEAETPLLVDSHAVFSLSVPVQCFQAIPRWRCKISQFGGTIQLPEFSACDLLNRLKAPTAQAAVKPLSLGTPERPDHDSLYSARRITSNGILDKY
jgi:hypothetical protein